MAGGRSLAASLADRLDWGLDDGLVELDYCQAQVFLRLSQALTLRLSLSPEPGANIKLSSSGPGPGPRSGPGQVPGQVQKVQGLRTKGLDLG